MILAKLLIAKLIFPFYLVTAYCPCVICTPGKGMTKSGTRPIEGTTIACPSTMLGAVVLVPTGLRICQDTGKGIRGQRLDNFFYLHHLAKEWGRQIVFVIVLTPATSGAIMRLEIPPKPTQPALVGKTK